MNTPQNPLDLFTDREQFITAFRKTLVQAKPGIVSYLALKGTVGAGKTFLTAFLKDRLCLESGWIPIHVSFSANSNPNFQQILSQFETQLNRSFTLSSKPTKAFSSSSIQKFREKRDKYKDNFDNQRASISVTQNQLVRANGTIDNSPQMLEVYNSLDEQLIQLRDELLGAFTELCEELEIPICIIIDGFERLVQTNKELTSWILTEAIPRIASASNEKVISVVAGWIFPNEPNIQYSIQEFELEDFFPDDIKTYLEKRHILGEPSEDQTIVISDELVVKFNEITQGHPYFLDLACKYIESYPILERTPERLQANRPLLDNEARSRFLIDRILSRLQEPNNSLIRRGVILRQFDKASLQALIPEGMTINTQEYEEFLQYPFFSIKFQVDNFFKHSFHEIIRHIQFANLQQEESDLFVALHKKSYEFFATLDNRQNNVLIEKLYHALHVPELEETAFQEWHTHFIEALNDFDFDIGNEFSKLFEDLNDEGWKPTNKLDYIATLVSIGVHYNQLRATWTKALQIYFEVQTLAENVGDIYFRAVASNNIGAVYLWQGNFEKALEFHLKALDLFSQLSKIDLEHNPHKDIVIDYTVASALNNVGFVYFKQNKYDEALKYYTDAFDYAVKLGDFEKQATIKNNIGHINLNQGKMKEALSFFEEALSYLEGTEFYHTLGTVMGSLGNYYSLNENHVKELEYFNKSMIVHKETNDPTRIASSLLKVTTSYIKLKRLGEAQGSLDEAKFINETLQDNELGIEIEISISDILFTQEKYDEALEILKKTKEENDKHVNLELEYKILVHISHILKAQHHNKENLDIIDKYITTARNLGDPQKLATALSNKAFILNETGDYEAAIEIQSQCIKILETMPENPRLSGQKMALSNWKKKFNAEKAARYLNADDFENAISCLKQGLSICEENKDEKCFAATYHNIGNIYLKQKNHIEADNYYKLSKFYCFQIDDLQYITSLFGDMAMNCYEMGQLKEALQFQKNYIRNLEFFLKKGVQYPRINDLPKAYYTLAKWQQEEKR